MKEYRVTFGTKYAHEQHPSFPQAHPDGWLTVIAKNEMAAREVVFSHIGPAWCGIYPAPFDDRWPVLHPLGELARVDTSIVLSQKEVLAS